MNKEWEKVKLFHDKFGHPSSDRPAFIPKERAKDRAKWLMEEIAEFLVAPDIYFALGTLVEMGIKPDELFDIIQKANMEKLGEDGKPIYNPKDGKIMKPQHWEDPAPKIKAYIDNLSQNS